MTNNLVEVKDMLEAAIGKSRLLKESILKSEWETIVGDLSKKSFVKYLKDKKLFIGVENSIWIQQMNFQKKEIIKKTNDFLGENYIIDLVFQIGKKSPEDYFLEEEIEELEEIDLDTVSLTPEDYLEIKKELEEIKDDKIRNYTKDVLEKSFKRKKYLKLHGYKKCKCGSYYKSPEPMCAICMNKKKVEIEEILLTEFKSKSSLKYSQAVKKINGLKERDYNRIKLKKLSRLKREIEIYIKEKKYEKALELARLYFIIELATFDKDYIEKRAKEFIELLSSK